MEVAAFKVQLLSRNLSTAPHFLCESDAILKTIGEVFHML